MKLIYIRKSTCMSTELMKIMLSLAFIPFAFFTCDSHFTEYVFLLLSVKTLMILGYYRSTYERIPSLFLYTMYVVFYHYFVCIIFSLVFKAIVNVKNVSGYFKKYILVSCWLKIENKVRNLCKPRNLCSFLFIILILF